MGTFRKFMSKYNFPLLKEEAPVDPNNSILGGDSDTPQTHNRFSLRMQDEFDIDDKAMDAYDDTNTFVTYKAINYSSKWGFIASGPIPVTAEKIVDAGERSKYKVVFHLTQANKRKFYFPYKDGEVPVRYTGTVSDKTEYMSYSELEDLKSQGLDQVGQAGGAPGGMGGGMGDPPMGGGMGGGMGAPPMGGAPAPGGM